MKLLEELKEVWRLNYFDVNKLADYIRTKIPDREWNTLQETYKGSSCNKAKLLNDKWVDYNIPVEDIPAESMVVGISESDKIKNMFTDTAEDKKFYFVPPPRGLYKIGVDPYVTDDIMFSKPAVAEAADSKHKGLRFNEGKLRYDLVHPWSHEQMVRVLTKGSQKYAERNWEKGMEWSKAIASMKRHTAAIERGEDYDIDPSCPECQKSTKENWVCKNHTGELHAALAQCNAHFLTAYYKIYPQGDDRPKPYLSHKKIGLDIDDVLADFVGAWLERYPQNKPNFWNFDKDIKQKFQEVALDKDFWMSIKPKISPDDLPFEPHCYITSRMIPNAWTEEWLQANGFPAVPVYTVGFNESKVEVAKESGIDIFVDDRFENFVELNNAGVCTFLMDAAHNRRYDVQSRRIFSLKDLM